METVGFVVSIVSLATLFKSCVECFDYFSEVKNSKKDFTQLLIRLDFEKTQLLLWGNSSGILQVEKAERHARLTDPAICKLVEEALKAIQILLSDANTLQQRYGVQSTVRPAKKHLIDPNDISANSMNLFRTAWSRFCVRMVPDRSGTSTIARTRWAIHDKAKFTDLVETLSTLVANLHKVIPVPDAQYEVLESDLAAIIDISRLKLVETALQSSINPKCQALSRAASEIIEESERGTTDRRRLMEWLGDTQLTQEADDEEQEQDFPIPLPQSERLSLVDTLKCLTNETQQSIYFVNTQQCLNRNTATPCPSMATADILSNVSYIGGHHLELWPTLASFFPNLKPEKLKSYEYSKGLEQLFSCGPDDVELKAHLSDELEIMIPFGTIYIHTSPCSCALQMALAIARSLTSKYLPAHVRVDDRISCSCYPSATGRVMALEAIADHLEKVPSASWPLDRLWLHQRLYMLENDAGLADNTTPMSSALNIFSKDNFPDKLAGLVIVGEVDFCTPLLQAEPFLWTARFPRQCEIYEITHHGYSYHRRYIGRFAARLPPNAVNNTSAQRQAGEVSSLVSQSSFQQSSSKRAASPTPFAGAKRAATVSSKFELEADREEHLDDEDSDE